MYSKTRTTLILFGVVLATALLLTMGGCSWLKSGDTEEEPGWSEIDWPDCENPADMSPRWESSDCGKSPATSGKVTIKVSPKKTTGKATPKVTKTTGRTTQGPGTQRNGLTRR